MFCVESFKTIIRAATADALPDSDFNLKSFARRAAARAGYFLSVRFR